MPTPVSRRRARITPDQTVSVSVPDQTVSYPSLTLRRMLARYAVGYACVVGILGYRSFTGGEGWGTRALPDR